MNDLTMTVTGWVATDPKMHVGASGVSMATFRLASTSRYYDRVASAWTDGQTEWFTVRVFRHAAALVAESISKGQPVSVNGRFRTNTWQAEDGPRTDLVLDAITVGHDLTRGIAKYHRAVVETPAAEDSETVDDTAEAGEPGALDEAAVEPGEPEGAVKANAA